LDTSLHASFLTILTHSESGHIHLPNRVRHAVKEWLRIKDAASFSDTASLHWDRSVRRPVDHVAARNMIRSTCPHSSTAIALLRFLRQRLKHLSLINTLRD